MADLTIPQQLRAAVTRLRCEHAFPLQPPYGSIASPGDCRHCGMRWVDEIEMPDQFQRPLAELLEHIADGADDYKATEQEPAPGRPLVVVDEFGGSHSDWTAALAVARFIIGTPLQAIAETGGAR